MKHLRFKRIGDLSIRGKMTLIVLGILMLTLAGVSVTVSHFSSRYYTGLQQQYNEHVMKEVSYQLNACYQNTEELYLTFNSQKPFSEETTDGTTVFQSVYKQIQFENSVLNVVNANNLQSLIVGTLFWLNDDCYCYVGKNNVERGFDFTETDWYRQFVQSGGKRMLYGPLTEDFKPVTTERYRCVYYIAPYGVSSSKASVPFILFTLNLDTLMKPVDAFLQDGRKIFVTDANGDLIHSAGVADSESAALLSQVLEETDGSTGSVSRFLDGYYLSSYTLGIYGWRISFLDPTKTVFRELSVMNTRINLIVLAFAVLGILSASWMIRRATMPLAVLNHFIDIMEDDPNAFIEGNPHTETGKIGLRFNEMKRNLQRMNEEMYLARLQEKEAQVSALQAQINPHFLYNTLDNIYCIAQLGETEPILCLSDRLSQMLRYSMSMKQAVVPLSDELRHVDNYVAILNVRFDDRIQLKIDVPEPLRNALVLKLSLQPLAENAWRHGLLESGLESGLILISAASDDEYLDLFVDNDGAAVPQDRCDALNASLLEVHYGASDYSSGHGIALENINNRIKLTFGPDFGLRLSPRAEGGCRVTMHLPLARSSGPASDIR